MRGEKNRMEKKKREKKKRQNGGGQGKWRADANLTKEVTEGLLGFEPLNLLLDSLILLQLFDVCPATMQVGTEEKNTIKSHG